MTLTSENLRQPVKVATFENDDHELGNHLRKLAQLGGVELLPPTKQPDQLHSYLVGGLTADVVVAPGPLHDSHADPLVDAMGGRLLVSLAESATDVHEDTVAEQGALGYLIHPYSPGELLWALREVGRGNQYFGNSLRVDVAGRQRPAWPTRGVSAGARLDQQKVGAAAADLAHAAGELQRESEVLLDATDMEEHPDLRVAHALIVLVAQPAIAEAARSLERLGRDPSDTELAATSGALEEQHRLLERMGDAIGDNWQQAVTLTAGAATIIPPVVTVLRAALGG